ncbi:MAG: trypsin-like serine protease [Verrucomicrobiota bacterium]
MRPSFFALGWFGVLAVATALPAAAEGGRYVEIPETVDPNVVVSGTGAFATPSDAETTPGVPFPGVVGTAGVNHDGVAALNATIAGTTNTTGGSTALLWTGRHVLTAAHVLTDASGTLNISTGSLFYETSGGVVVYGFDAADVTIHPGWNGVFGTGVDLAIITLDNQVDFTVPRYQVFNGNLVDDLVNEDLAYFRFGAGYGQTGTGTTGAQNGTSGVKRFGYNVYDGVFVDGQGTPEDIYILYDFDSGLEENNLLGATGLGELEANTAPGDSGSPGFIYDEESGEYLIGGVTSFSARLADGPGQTDIDGALNRTFGEYSADINVGAYRGWIASVVPEPATGSLLVFGGAAALLLRRRRRV